MFYKFENNLITTLLKMKKMWFLYRENIERFYIEAKYLMIKECFSYNVPNGVKALGKVPQS